MLVGRNADDLNAFRRKYFQSFKTSNTPRGAPSAKEYESAEVNGMEDLVHTQEAAPLSGNNNT